MRHWPGIHFRKANAAGAFPVSVATALGKSEPAGRRPPHALALNSLLRLSAQKSNDRGKIETVAAMIDKTLIDRGGSGRERRDRSCPAGGLMRDAQVLEHHRGCKTGLIVAISG